MTEAQLHGHGHPDSHAAVAVAHDEGQHHPLRVYFVVWGWLFVLSFGSYMVDYIGLQGFLRWFLILAFMLLKAGLIIAVFMHMAWERLSLVYAIILPMLRPTILTCVVLLTTAVVKGYDLVVALTGGGPGDASDLPALFVVNAAFERANIGLASAGAVVMVLSIVAALAPYFYIELSRRDK